MGERLKHTYLGLKNRCFSVCFLVHTIILFLFNYKQIAELTQHLAVLDQLFLYQKRVISLTSTDLRVSNLSQALCLNWRETLPIASFTTAL